MNGINPHACLKATLETVAGSHLACSIGQLMPWVLTQTSG